MKVAYVIGIDEVGRGPVAGPVAVAACVVRKKFKWRLVGLFPDGLVRDSKKLSPKAREKILSLMGDKRDCGEISYAVSFSSQNIIDRSGIVFAVQRALNRTLKSLGAVPKECLVLLDGNLKAPKEFFNQRTIIKGDEKEPIIALASIAAKLARDRKMISLSKKYPRYDFHINKGYGTKKHYAKIRAHGLSPIHRRSFLKGLIF